jgi:hypothetical protein
VTHCLVNHHVTGHLVFVLVSTESVKMCPTIQNPANCKIRAVIRFLHAKIMGAAEIHRELFAVYDQNIMNEGTLRQRRRVFRDGRKKCSQ